MKVSSGRVFTLNPTGGQMETKQLPHHTGFENETLPYPIMSAKPLPFLSMFLQ